MAGSFIDDTPWLGMPPVTAPRRPSPTPRPSSPKPKQEEAVRTNAGQQRKKFKGKVKQKQDAGASGPSGDEGIQADDEAAQPRTNDTVRFKVDEKADRPASQPSQRPAFVRRKSKPTSVSSTNRSSVRSGWAKSIANVFFDVDTTVAALKQQRKSSQGDTSTSDVPRRKKMVVTDGEKVGQRSQKDPEYKRSQSPVRKQRPTRTTTRKPASSAMPPPYMPPLVQASTRSSSPSNASSDASSLHATWILPDGSSNSVWQSVAQDRHKTASTASQASSEGSSIWVMPDSPARPDSAVDLQGSDTGRKTNTVTSDTPSGVLRRASRIRDDVEERPALNLPTVSTVETKKHVPVFVDPRLAAEGTIDTPPYSSPEGSTDNVRLSGASGLAKRQAHATGRRASLDSNDTTRLNAMYATTPPVSPARSLVSPAASSTHLRPRLHAGRDCSADQARSRMSYQAPSVKNLSSESSSMASSVKAPATQRMQSHTKVKERPARVDPHPMPPRHAWYPGPPNAWSPTPPSYDGRPPYYPYGSTPGAQTSGPFQSGWTNNPYIWSPQSPPPDERWDLEWLETVCPGGSASQMNYGRAGSTSHMTSGSGSAQ